MDFTQSPSESVSLIINSRFFAPLNHLPIINPLNNNNNTHAILLLVRYWRKKLKGIFSFAHHVFVFFAYVGIIWVYLFVCIATVCCLCLTQIESLPGLHIIQENTGGVGFCL